MHTAFGEHMRYNWEVSLVIVDVDHFKRVNDTHGHEVGDAVLRAIAGTLEEGIRATDVSKTAEIGRLVAAFPVGNEDQIMLVSDGGQVIRVPVGGIRIASRATKGVTIFNTADGEKVVSVERISDTNGEDEESLDGGVEAEAGAESAD